MAFLTLEEMDKKFRENPPPGLYSYRSFRQRMENEDALDEINDPRRRAQMLSLEAFGFNPLMMPMIAPERALSQARKAITGYGKRMLKSGVPRAAAYAEEGVQQLDLSDLFRKLPEGAWERLEALLPAKNIPGSPEATGLFSTKGGARKIWLSTKSKTPVKDLGHEIAHYLDDLFEGVEAGQFSKLRGIWNEMADDMASMSAFWENRSAVEGPLLYRYSPNEVFARRFADAIVDEGMSFRDAVKIAAHETRANLANSRDILHDSIDAANTMLKEQGLPGNIEKPWYWTSTKGGVR